MPKPEPLTSKYRVALSEGVSKPFGTLITAPALLRALEAFGKVWHLVRRPSAARLCATC